MYRFIPSANNNFKDTQLMPRTINCCIKDPLLFRRELRDLVHLYVVSRPLEKRASRASHLVLTICEICESCQDKVNARGYLGPTISAGIAHFLAYLHLDSKLGWAFNSPLHQEIVSWDRWET